MANGDEHEHRLTVFHTGEATNGDLQVMLPPTPKANEFRKPAQVGQHVGLLLAQCEASDAAAAIIPWFCDALASPKSRRDYFGDLSRFLSVMRQQGVHPYNVNGDHVRLYKEAMKEQGLRAYPITPAALMVQYARAICSMAR